MANSHRVPARSVSLIVDTERRIASLDDFIDQLRNLDELRGRVRAATLLVQRTRPKAEQTLNRVPAPTTPAVQKPRPMRRGINCSWPSRNVRTCDNSACKAGHGWPARVVKWTEQKRVKQACSV